MPALLKHLPSVGHQLHKGQFVQDGMDAFQTPPYLEIHVTCSMPCSTKAHPCEGVHAMMVALHSAFRPRTRLPQMQLSC